MQKTKTPLPENPWELLGLAGGTGDSGFDAYWRRLYAAQREFLPLPVIVSNAINGREFDGTTVPQPFLDAAERFDWRAARREEERTAVVEW